MVAGSLGKDVRIQKPPKLATNFAFVVPLISLNLESKVI